MLRGRPIRTIGSDDGEGPHLVMCFPWHLLSERNRSQGELHPRIRVARCRNAIDTGELHPRIRVTGLAHGCSCGSAFPLRVLMEALCDER